MIQSYSTITFIFFPPSNEKSPFMPGTKELANTTVQGKIFNSVLQQGMQPEAEPAAQ